MDQLIATLGFMLILVVLVPLIYTIYISIRILQKAGYSGWWIVVATLFSGVMNHIFPGTVGYILGFIPLWLFAFVLKWPAEAMASSAPTMEAPMQQAPAEQKMDDTNTSA